MDPSQIKIPPMKDLTIDNITENVHITNSQCDDPRVKYLFERLVTHLHDYARETRLSSWEWMAAIEYLTKVGQICSDVRQEFILLSDILGLSLLVDSIDHPKPPSSTEGTVLGPFHTHDAKDLPNGNAISGDPDGEPLLVLCTVKDMNGKPIEGAQIGVWETDSKGSYDVQYAKRDGPDGRAVLHSDKNGIFWFKAIVPVPYPIPHDGPVGQLLKVLNRHPYRSSHMHFMFDKPGYDHLITYVFFGVSDKAYPTYSALYLRHDPYETSDAVFGVKESLVVELSSVTEDMVKQYIVPANSRLMTYDFSLVSEDDAMRLRDEKAREAMEAQGRKMKFYNGLPVPEVD